MVKTYILAPDYSTAPPPAGPVQLGDVLTNLNELVATNKTERVPIPTQDLLPADYKYNLRATRSELRAGNLGVWAQVASVFGVGVEAGWSHEAQDTDVFNFNTVITHAFNPTDEYVRAVLDSRPVQAYIRRVGGKKGYVFMLTGLKVGQGARVETQHSVANGFSLKLGFAHPGVPVEGGPEAGFRKRRLQGLSFDGSTDFIIAFRVRKVVYRLRDCTSSLSHQACNNQASMLDGSEEDQKDSTLDLHLEVEGDASLTDVQADRWGEKLQSVLDSSDGDEETTWVIPRAN